MWRSLAAEVKTLINDLTKSNYLVYDKAIRAQKLSVIDGKLKLLENVRINAETKVQTLQGYFGNTGVRRSNKMISSGSSLGSGITPMRATPKAHSKLSPWLFGILRRWWIPFRGLGSTPSEGEPISKRGIQV